MLQLPTGGGKTVIFAEIARQFLKVNRKKVLVNTHRVELIDQAAEKLQAQCGLLCGYIKSGAPIYPQRDIQVASVQTLARRQYPQNVGLIIVDEAHHAAAKTYTDIMEAYPDASILGVTATPTRADGQGFQFLFDDLITGPSVKWLIDKGYLSQYKMFAAEKLVKTQGVKERGGDFDLKELAKAVDTSLVMGDVIESWRKHAAGKRTVLFAVDVSHSQQSAIAFQDAGISAAHLDGETPPEERKAMLEQFKRGEILVLCNCGIVSEGLDVPAIEAIQCVRPTESLIFWLQMIGRSLRPHPSKEYAIVIDHTQNWLYHGLPDDDRDWNLEPTSLTTLRFNQQCPNCRHIFRPLSHEQKRLKCSCPICLTQIALKMGGGTGLFKQRIMMVDETQEIVEAYSPDGGISEKTPQQDAIGLIQSDILHRNYVTHLSKLLFNALSEAETKIKEQADLFGELTPQQKKTARSKLAKEAVADLPSAWGGLSKSELDSLIQVLVSGDMTPDSITKAVLSKIAQSFKARKVLILKPTDNQEALNRLVKILKETDNKDLISLLLKNDTFRGLPLPYTEAFCQEFGKSAPARKNTKAAASTTKRKKTGELPPDGTLCRFKYGGRKMAEIRAEGKILKGLLVIEGQGDFKTFNAAASSLTGKEIANGTKFWEVKLPDDSSWINAKKWLDEDRDSGLED